MNIAILSGKGGTGKTTVAANLALIMKANYIDCDVEEPNGFIFLKPENITNKKVEVDCPVIDEEKCNLCGDCTRACQFNALFNNTKKILLFEKLCHSCKACAIVCPTEAISFAPRSIGVIEEGSKDDLICKRGVLDVGEPMAVPVIRQLLKDKLPGTNLLDCAPGTSCNAVACLRGADTAVLVTEPSAFGMHDLKMAITLVRDFGLPYGVIINKWKDGGSPLEDYLEKENIRILGKIPYDRKAAEIYSRGKMLKDLPIYQEAFEDIATELREVFSWK